VVNFFSHGFKWSKSATFEENNIFVIIDLVWYIYVKLGILTYKIHTSGLRRLRNLIKKL